MKFSHSLLPLALALPFAVPAQSVPSTLNYQGRLTDNTPQQNPLNGTVMMQIEIWDVGVGGSASPDRLWREPDADGGSIPVPVNGGLFSVTLGAVNPLPASLFTGVTSTRYLQIILNPGATPEVLSPRQLLSSTGYAGLAQHANLADSAAQLGGVAAAGWQKATTQSCASGSFLSAIDPAGNAACTPAPANALTPPLTLSGTFAVPVLTLNNAGLGGGIEVTASGTGVGSTAITGHNSLGYKPAIFGYNSAASPGTSGYFYGAGVAGYSDTGVGVSATSVSGAALAAVTQSSGVAVQGTSAGTGWAGYFELENSGNANPALTGFTSGYGAGVYGASERGDGVSATTYNDSGNAIYGEPNSFGRAAYFRDVKALSLTEAVGVYAATLGPGVKVTLAKSGSAAAAIDASTAGNGAALAGVSAGGPGVVGQTASAAAAGVRAVGAGGAGTALRLESGGLQIAGAGADTPTAAFVHVTAAANTSGAASALSNPHCNGRADAILIVTHNQSPTPAAPAVPFNRAVGVVYAGGLWSIVAEDGADLPPGLAFNVLILNP